jgi:acyl-CoA hydrolase/GNAT superfamily N-acetyltransferase
MDWKKKVVSPEKAFEKIRPGMSIFIGSGVSEPRMLVKHLMASDASNLQDLELIQLVSFGEAITLDALRSRKFRLKTFYSGWVASEAISAGRVDLIPTRFSRIPRLFESGRISVDVAFVQIAPPTESGYCSLGASVDVALHAMQQASLVVGELNAHVPRTFGNTFVPVSEFDALVSSDELPIYFDRWPVAPVFHQIAANVADRIEDGSCIAFGIGPLFEALSQKLTAKRHLGVHTPFMTDALMELIQSGAVTNRYKKIFPGKTLVSYALGTKELLSWLHENPIVEFQGIDKIFDPIMIGKNPRATCVLYARKVDLSGRIALTPGRGNVTELGDADDFFHGIHLSPAGLAIVALPSRNRKGEPKIRTSVEELPNLFGSRDLVDMVITEYGVARLGGRTLRERAQAIIEVAHPDDRRDLLEEAKAQKILYADQIYLEESSRLYPSQIAVDQTFQGDIKVRFRAIKPSDEEEMRRLFYRFSEESVYYRYFSPLKTMPHAKMQEYVNVDYRNTMSIIGLVGDVDHERIIAEARYVRHRDRPYADLAFVVDEKYQGLGIATFLYKFLVKIAKERGLEGFTGDVLATNKAMMKVFERGDLPVKATLEAGVYELTIPFNVPKHTGGTKVQYDRRSEK